MTEKEIVIKAANTIDEAAIKISYDLENESTVIKYKHHFLGLKWGKQKEKKVTHTKRTHFIRGAKLRTMIRIESLAKQIDTDQIFSADNITILAQIIASAIHNSKTEVPKELVFEIINNLSAQDLYNVMLAVKEQENMQAFLNTIVLTAPIQIQTKEQQTSPQEQEEMIAPGEQLELLQNIFASATMKY